jgi:hypothetical protein
VVAALRGALGLATSRRPGKLYELRESWMGTKPAVTGISVVDVEDTVPVFVDVVVNVDVTVSVSTEYSVVVDEKVSVSGLAVTVAVCVENLVTVYHSRV